MSDFSVRLVASANLIRFVRFVALWCSRTFEMLPLITVFQRERSLTARFDGQQGWSCHDPGRYYVFRGADVPPARYDSFVSPCSNFAIKAARASVCSFVAR